MEFLDHLRPSWIVHLGHIVEFAPVSMVPGNHDARLEAYLYRQAMEVYDLDVWSLRRLLKLDELDVDLVQHPLGWTHAEATIADGLVGRHGWLCGKTATEKMLTKRGISLIHGHLHKRSSYFSSIPALGCELEAHGLGCACRIDDSYPGYATCVEWNRGFGLVTRLGDDFVFEQVPYFADRLIWRDQLFVSS